MFNAKTAFEARVTNNSRNDLINVTGRYQASSACLLYTSPSPRD